MSAVPGVVESPYTPREHFIPFHQRRQRFTAMVVHRRAGKTVACINDLIAKAMYSKKPRPVYAYIGPLRNQAKRIAWEYLKMYSEGLISKTSESELYVEMKHNGARIYVCGADNPDSFRGLYFDGAVIDEYGDMNPLIYTQILTPAIADRKGWLVFIGTPKGKNHFWEQWQIAIASPNNWYTLLLRASESKLLDDEELGLMRANMGPDEYAQELECSFEAAVKGAYYADIISQLEIRGQITAMCEYDPDFDVEVASDLGYTDASAYWFWQSRPDGIAMIDYYEASSEPLSHYFDMLDDKGYRYSKLWLPHDAQAKTLQTGRSTVEQFLEQGYPIDIIPRLKRQHGIDALRSILPDIWFNPRCRPGLEALRAYKRKWDPIRKIESAEPLHDWSSHGADAARGFALVAKERIMRVLEKPSGAQQFQAEPVCLEELFQEYEERKKFRRH